MLNSVLDSREGHDRVRSYLQRALPNCRLRSQSLVSGYPPLIFMSMKRLMAAFAFPTGNTEASYDRLYSSFKDYYAKNREELDAFDLSFVFCVRPDFSQFHAFCSQVETDTLFCRKFVVRVAEPVEESFERLPFLPLVSTSRGSWRPLSAQTYLRRCGVPAVLARYLSVPHQRGPANIVKDCLEQRSNWTPILARRGASSVPRVDSERDLESIRLNSLSVRSFRAYKAVLDIEFGAAVTVLYGPNGFGKTSLFDALDFVATGGIGRLGLSSSQDRFAKVVAHLDGNLEDSVVSLRFGANGREHTLTRRVASSMQPSLDGSISDRKTTLVKLTGGGFVPAERIEHLVTLFRATHIFSQDNPEMGKGFHRDCTLPPQVVSHILAFEDYASARSKASAVCEILQDSISRMASEISRLTKEIEEAERGLNSLASASGEGFDSTVSLEALQSLRSRVQDEGLSVAFEHSDQRFVRVCRAAIQGRIRQHKTKISGLAVLIDQVRDLPAVTHGLTRLLAQRKRLESDLETASVALTEAQDTLTSANLTVSELVAKRRSAVAYTELLRWASVEQPRYADLIGREERAIRAATNAATELDELHRRRVSHVTDLQAREAESARLATKLGAARTMTLQLEALASTADGVRRLPEEIRHLNDGIEDSLSRVESLRRDEAEIFDQLKGRAGKQSRLEYEIGRIDREQSELSQLLSRIQEQIDQSSCPLCGHDHGSPDDLRVHIAKHRNQDVAGSLRVELAYLRQDNEMSQNRLRDLQEAVEHESLGIERWEVERSECESRLTAFAEAVTRIGVLGEASLAMVDEIRARQRREQQEIDRVALVNQTLQEGLRQARSNVADVEARIAVLETALIEAQQEISNCGDEIAELRIDRRFDQLSLNMVSDELAYLDRRHRSQVVELEPAFAMATEKANAIRSTMSYWLQQVDSLEAKIDTLGREIGARRETVVETTTRLAEHGLGTDADEESLVGILEMETKAQGRMADLGDFADSVEMTIDTVATAAALKQQRAAIRERRRVVDETSSDLETHRAWQQYFSDLTEKVSATQNAAITGFATEYGPMASAIQQRLRCVYGFDGVDTRSHEATIRVSVKRGGQVLRPTDYFSHSQQQTLLLGLFLTACMSQTWSSLSTVLLDDPVTHFDDLNTYAFLDMIVGLLTSESGPRQFILSTCNRRVLHLARSKLRQLGRSVRFYEFSAIGEDGPVVKEVVPG